MSKHKEPFRWVGSGRWRDRPLVRYVAVGILVSAAYSLLGFPGMGLPLFFPLRALLVEPLVFVQTSIVMYFVLWTFWGGRRRADADGNIGIPPPPEREVLATAVRSLLDSEHFLTALRDALPGSEAGGQAHLAQVPYILKTINDRREVAQRETRRFLALTVGAGCVFASVVIYYGYILVNETAAGFPAAISDLRTATEEVRVALATKGQAIPERPDAKAAMDALARLDQTVTEKFPWSDELQSKVREAGSRQAGPSALLELDKFLTAHATDVTAVTGSAADPDGLGEAIARYVSAAAEVGKLAETVSREQAEVSARLDRVDAVAKRAADSASEGPSRIAELVKRVTVGFVVSSFLLAILRYLAGLYREARALVSDLVEQELKVRRVCVALASTSEGPVRDGIVRRFAAGAGAASGPMAEEALKEAAERDKELLKELIQVLGKKLE